MRRAALALGLAACTPSPERVLASYSAHVQAGRIEAAYALTSERYRARHDLPAFAAAVARSSVVPRPFRTLGTELVVSAGAVTLVGSDGAHLKLARDPLDVYRHDTPEAALRAFVQAAQHDRRDALVAVTTLPLRSRVHLSAAEVVPLPDAVATSAKRIADELEPRAGLALPILEQDGGTARLLLGEALFVGLSETQDGWQISELP